MTRFEFACRSCKWMGTQPELDAHLNAWCPKCGKPAEFADILRLQERAREPD
ncbi:MAG TPA: hypothetical protein VM582_06480 [Candidatus Thermoplasmatota archaeon]|nr:hypothetical protein [Candidatus Thermoplasmatota archaeon]